MRIWGSTFIAVAIIVSATVAEASNVPANQFGNYQVPVNDPKLKAYADYPVPFKKFEIDASTGLINLEITLPEALTGNKPYNTQFQGKFLKDGIFILRQIAEYPADQTTAAAATHSLHCTAVGITDISAITTFSLVCLAKWQNANWPFNETQLREHLREISPDLSAEALESKVVVANVFRSNGIGILSFHSH